MDFKELKEIALAFAKEKIVNDFIACGSVASALLTQDGNVYTGISIDTACSMGFCAEHGAIADMLKHNEYKIVKLVAITQKGEVVPPCGRCREFISQLTKDNRNTLVEVKSNVIVTIGDLLPYDWKEETGRPW